MNVAISLKQQYDEAVLLHLWYSASPFSLHQGKASKDIADKYRRQAHELLATMNEGKQVG